ncbi:arginine--tRNA ligase [Ruminococcaceae bacterium OttesenSCG-928-I18]|nr:arginine--tRNA ligase [Ruminococcaceae bacterium OttesenSCG-928-I18]
MSMEVKKIVSGAGSASPDDLRKVFHHVDVYELARQEAVEALQQALQKAVEAGELPAEAAPAYAVEIPADAAHGDLAANLALVSAKTFKMPPRKIAEALKTHFPSGSVFEKVEVAGPGFINLFLSGAWYASVLMAACSCGEEYGKTDGGNGKKINVEFVSANPTGPMHLGNARGAALGDCLAEALSMAGYEVTREFYINDAGNQVVKFGKSLAARYMQIMHGEEAVPFPEDGYQGEDITRRAREFYELHGEAYADKSEEEREQALVEYALPKNIEGLRHDLEKYRVLYDVWFPESKLHEAGEVMRVVEELRERGAAYEKEGTIWYRAEEEDGKDEVLVRANGIPTYFAADIAYHADKFARGFDRAIDIWGADHHGHVARMKGAMKALGLDESRLDIVLMQFVRLVRDGQQVKMSKRTGKAITLTDLLDEVPIDSARFFFNQREPGSTIEFDLDLAVSQDSENPVYYVQYAHARICSLLRTLEEEQVVFDPQAAFANAGLLADEKERALIRQVAAFPGEVRSAAEGYDPARITRYLIEVATVFHRFYTACRIKGEEPKLQQARLALCMAAKTVLANGLNLLKVTVPQRM